MKKEHLISQQSSSKKENRCIPLKDKSKSPAKKNATVKYFEEDKSKPKQPNQSFTFCNEKEQSLSKHNI